MNIEELKRLAEAATPGPWTDQACFHGEDCWCRIAISESAKDQDGDPYVIFHPGSVGARDARFIAAANPAAILELIRQRDQLLAALKSYRSAGAMPSYGDYASIQWESQQGPTNHAWGGGDCKKHGRWYGHCHCCANDWDKLKKQADQDAVHARDNALQKADTLAAEAIRKIEG